MKRSLIFRGRRTAAAAVRLAADDHDDGRAFRRPPTAAEIVKLIAVFVTTLHFQLSVRVVGRR